MTIDNDDKKQYVTINEGVDFRTIAKVMTGRGYKMNHATARNVLINAMRKLLSHVAGQAGTNVTNIDLEQLIKDQNIHSALADVLLQAHNEGQSKNDKNNVGR